VAPDSKMETFGAVRMHINSWRWADVPFLIRAGKCMAVTATEVLVRLKKPPLGKRASETNYLRFRLSPDFELAMSAQIKRPGRELVSIPVELSAVATDKSAEVAPYEHLLTDAMRGVATLFVREDAVEAAWAIVDPVLGDATPLAEYQPGSWGTRRGRSVGGRCWRLAEPRSGVTPASCFDLPIWIFPTPADATGFGLASNRVQKKPFPVRSPSLRGLPSRQGLQIGGNSFRIGVVHVVDVHWRMQLFAIWAGAVFQNVLDLLLRKAWKTR
jgi:hypothetical protein